MPSKVSVAMAAYNGERYIREQIDSILMQLSEQDELIISYNDSIDSTWDIITLYASRDSRVCCIRCEERGVIQNFNNSILNCTGDYIFLTDQDDIWEPNKVSTVIDAFERSKASLVIHNCSYIDSSGSIIAGDLFKRRKARPGFLKNLTINSYQGSCMAFRSQLKNIICPIPTNISMHDQWIGLIAEKNGGSNFLDKKLIKYRRHENTTSDISVGLITKLSQMANLTINMLSRV